jgi:hypothetical protein
MPVERWGRAVVSVIAIYAGLFALGALAMRDCGQMSRHVRDSLRPGMTVGEVIGATRGRLIAHAYPASEPDGRHGFLIFPFGIQRDDAGRQEPPGKPDALVATMEDEMKKRPGNWLLYFEYRTMESRWNTCFEVTIGPDMRVREVSALQRKRAGS